MKNLYKKKYLIIGVTIFVVGFLFGSNVVNAATLNFSPSSGNFTVGNIFTVNILVNTQSVSVNNGEVVINFPKDLLEVVSISKSGSIFSLWVEEPNFSNNSGTISFNGGIPTPGFNGSTGKALSVVFRVKKIGGASVVFSSASIRANDGLGTDVLTAKNQANFNLTKAVEKIPTPTIIKEVVTEISSSITIEELKKKNESDSSVKFLITSVGKKEKSLYGIKIDDIEYLWENQESGIFETSSLLKGKHIIKVSMDTVDKNTISNSLSFTIDGASIPKFTEYSENIREKDYIVVKGLADPNVEIVMNIKAILTNTNQILAEETTIKTNDKGLFTYVSDEALAGVYNIIAYSRTKTGLESERTSAITVTVVSKSLPILNTILNTLSSMVPVIALIILILILAIWGWYKVLHYKENMHKKLIRNKNLIAKSFDILDEDVAEEIKIFKKIKASQSLTDEERLFINQFKKDLESAEKIITDNIK